MRSSLRDVLRGLQREAAGEDAEPPEHGLLVRRQQAVAPFQRRAQRLMPAQHDARARSEHVEAFVEARAQAFDAEQRHPRRGEFDRERNAVQPPADLDDRRRMRGRQREVRIDRLRARDEEFDGAGRAARSPRHRRRGTASAPTR